MHEMLPSLVNAVVVRPQGRLDSSPTVLGMPPSLRLARAPHMT